MTNEFLHTGNKTVGRKAKHTHIHSTVFVNMFFNLKIVD